MATIADLNYTDNMAANKKPLLTDLRASLDSIETYINDSLKDNLIQFVGDAFPSGYAFSSDAVEKFTTSDLYDKLTAQATYTGGNITIATTAAWTDVDASNARVQITPDYLTGDFKVVCQFNVSVVTTNATNEADLRFRLTDSTTNSNAIANVHLVTGVNATTTVVPVTLVHEFDSWSTAIKTVKLQYFINTTTATTILVRANTNSPIAFQVEKI